MNIKIDPTKCVKHENCPVVLQCPARAFTQQNKGEMPKIDTTKCLQCLMCVSICPAGAVSFEE